MNQPCVLQLIMDSLRYWVQEMHVDGFRFDLASTLARERYDVDRLSSFFDIIQQDPVLSRVKLIAEPWDLGKSGYQVGNFPPLWAEWNGKYRDTVRRFWRGDKNQIADLAYRLTGSSDLYERSARKPCASINFVTAHDGFTLHDLVSYNEKHNEANLEANCDGIDDNLSWNCGVEGRTDTSDIIHLRERQKKNFMAMLLLSQGVPMVLGGDEIGRTQNGNNNAYCQDNEISWLDWSLDDEKSSLLAFTRTLINIRRNHPVFKRRDFFQGKDVFGSDNKDITWLRPDGREMTADDWRQPDLKSIGALLSGDEIDEMNERGECIVDDTFLLLLNANANAVGFLLPGENWRWSMELLTDSESGDSPKIQPAGGEVLALSGRSIMLLRRMKE
jgi:isoamylase